MQIIETFKNRVTLEIQSIRVTGCIGRPEISLAPLVGALASGDLDVLTTIPGVTSEIAAAGGLALQQAYNVAFSYVWAAAAAFSFPALVGKCPHGQIHY